MATPLLVPPVLSPPTELAETDKTTEDGLTNMSDSDSSISSRPQTPTNAGKDLILDVECGLNKAVLYLNRLSTGSKGACVHFDNAWLTPNEFQYVSGRETAKDWKRSIKHYGKSLKLLIAKGFMSTEPASCKCEGCVVTDDKPACEKDDTQPKANQENVPPASQAQVTSIHSPEVDRIDKDRVMPEVSDSHVIGSTGSEGRTSMEICERPVLQCLGEDAGDAKEEAAKKMGKKRKSQSKTGEKPKKPKKGSHDSQLNPLEMATSEAVEDGINGDTDQSCVAPSGGHLRHKQTGAPSHCKSSPPSGTEDGDGVKAAQENPHVSDGDGANPAIQSNGFKHGKCTPTSVLDSPLKYANPKAIGVNGVGQITDKTSPNKDSTVDNLSLFNGDYKLANTDYECTDEEHFIGDDSSAVPSGVNQTESHPDQSVSIIVDEKITKPSQNQENAIEQSLPAHAAIHEHSSIATDVTSPVKDDSLTRISEMTNGAQTSHPDLGDANQDCSTESGKTDGVRLHKVEYEEQITGNNARSGTSSPNSQMDDEAEECGQSEDLVPLSPRKEARLTCIIAELKSYKKQLIRRIEDQIATGDSDTDDDSDGDSESSGSTSDEEVANINSDKKQSFNRNQKSPENAKTSKEDTSDAEHKDMSPKCRTLYDILSSGATNNNDNNISNNNTNDRSEPARSTPDTQPVKSTFDKTPRPENKKSNTKSHHSDSKATLGDTPKADSDVKQAKDVSKAAPVTSVTMSVPVATHVAVTVPPIPNSMYLAPPIFPYPYGVPPGYLYPGGLYGGFPFPDPTAIYKSLAASHALPTTSTTGSSPVPRNATTSPGIQSLIPNALAAKRESKSNSKISRKRERSRLKSSTATAPRNVTVPTHWAPFPPHAPLDATHVPVSSRLTSCNGPSSKSAKHPVQLSTALPAKNRYDARDIPNCNTDNSGALDLSVRKRPSPVSTLDQYASSKIPCYGSNFPSHRNGMILDLSKGTTR